MQVRVSQEQKQKQKQKEAHPPSELLGRGLAPGQQALELQLAYPQRAVRQEQGLASEPARACFLWTEGPVQAREWEQVPGQAFPSSGPQERELAWEPSASTDPRPGRRESARVRRGEREPREEASAGLGLQEG